jgi:predicted nucleotidyltransferase
MSDAPSLPSVEDIFSRSTIELAVLFGSRARGTSTARSDFDIGVRAPREVTLAYADLGRLQVELSDRIAGSVDVVDLRTPDAIFRREVVLAARVLFERAPGAWIDFVSTTLIDYDDIAPFLPELVRGVARASQTRGRAK